MDHPRSHSLALFSLVPKNDRARDVLDHPHNRLLVSDVPGSTSDVYLTEMPKGLNIGTQIPSQSRYTLAKLGRNGDIVVEGSGISRIQCSFEIHEHTRQIMLYDRSFSKSTQTFGPNAKPFELDRPDRRVVVARGVNDEFGFGGVGSDLFQFKIHWHHDKEPPDFEKQINDRVDHPRFARTVDDDETPTVIPSQRVTRIHTPARTPGALTRNKIRYHPKD